MPLKHVVLAVLADAPGHGYEVHARLMNFLPLARPCDRSRVYAVLVGLEQDGRVRARVEDYGRGCMRKRYWLAASGRRSLEQWLRRPVPALDLLRRSLLLRLALIEWLDSGPSCAGGMKAWQRVLARRLRRREELLRVAGRGDSLQDLLRRRELAHLEVEIQTLRGWRDS